MVYLATELVPAQPMLKRKSELNRLGDDSEDIYLNNHYKQYLMRPPKFAALTCAEFYQWQRMATASEQTKSTQADKRGEQPRLTLLGNGDIHKYLTAESQVQNSQKLLNTRLESISDGSGDASRVFTLVQTMAHVVITSILQELVYTYITEVGIEMSEGNKQSSHMRTFSRVGSGFGMQGWMTKTFQDSSCIPLAYGP